MYKWLAIASCITLASCGNSTQPIEVSIEAEPVFTCDNVESHLKSDERVVVASAEFRAVEISACTFAATQIMQIAHCRAEKPKLEFAPRGNFYGLRPTSILQLVSSELYGAKSMSEILSWRRDHGTFLFDPSKCSELTQNVLVSFEKLVSDSKKLSSQGY